jgi:peptidoglycan/xylan/chitin deacetylase (PgdA/CDA1 family)
MTHRFTLTLSACLAASLLLVACAGCGGGTADAQADARAKVDSLLQKGVRPNEMGMVMVLEYHRVGERESDYTRSIDNFKKDLETLYQKGYRLVGFHDLMKGKIDVPAGTTPVVFSFDDSTESQIRYIKSGAKTVLDPECALGMMEAFHTKHPDFGYKALFNYLPALFDQPKYKKEKVDYLYNTGFEFGDHTVSHPSLAKVDDTTVQKEIAVPIQTMKSVNPKVSVDILCLPNGSIPKNQSLMYDGSYGGVTYHNNWALLVGANPMYPEYHYKNPGRLIPRIQVMDYNPVKGSGADGSDYWLRYFDKHPEVRFVSDGNPSTICAPAYMASRLLADRLPAGVQFLGY